MSRRILVGASLLADGAWLRGHGVLLDGPLIAGIVPDNAAPDAERVTLEEGTLLAPGLIDVQVNGGGGVQFNDAPSADTALSIAAAHRRLGTTAILPTLITDAPEKMREAAAAVADAARVAGGGVLGGHFEGPFLSPLRPGVHPPQFLRAPDEQDLALLCRLAANRGMPVVCTLAPEQVGDNAIRRLADAGVLLSAGHSAANFERVVQAVTSGLSGFTHVFNAMQPPTARDPGIVAAALTLSGPFCGVIMDGVHVHPAMIRLLLDAKGTDRVMLVSDAMAPAGTDLTSFVLQGRTILRRDGRLMTEDGVLAGADLCLAQAVRNAVGMGVSAAAALTMASAVPAAFLRLDDRFGRLASGYRADLVALTPALAVVGTWVAGDYLAAG